MYTPMNYDELQAERRAYMEAGGSPLPQHPNYNFAIDEDDDETGDEDE